MLNVMLLCLCVWMIQKEKWLLSPQKGTGWVNNGIQFQPISFGVISERCRHTRTQRYFYSIVANQMPALAPQKIVNPTYPRSILKYLELKGCTLDVLDIFIFFINDVMERRFLWYSRENFLHNRCLQRQPDFTGGTTKNQKNWRKKLHLMYICTYVSRWSNQ